MSTGTVVVGVLIIARNLDPKIESGWELLKPEDVPTWLNKPTILGALVDGHIAHDPEKGPHWYCAIQVPDPGKDVIGAANDEEGAEPKSLIIGAPSPKLTHSPEAVEAAMEKVKP